MSAPYCFNLSEYWYSGAAKWAYEETTRHLYDVFYLRAPELIAEKSAKTMSNLIALSFRSEGSRPLRSEWPLPSNRVRSWLADLAALGLVEPSTRKHPISDDEDYWCLTPLGKTIYSGLRRQRLEQGLSTKVAEDADGD